MKKIKFRALALLLTAAMALTAIVTGCKGNAKQSEGTKPGIGYPKGTITIIVPFAPGGGVDSFARVVAKYSEKYVGAPMAVVNKDGASGEIGWNEAAKSKPDGYTLAATVSPTTLVQPRLRKEGMSGYQPDDLEPIAVMSRLPSAIFVRKDSQFKTLEDLIAYAKQNPGKLTVTNNGNFGVDHIFTLQLEKELGIKVKRIVYKGGSEALKDVLGGKVDVMIANAMWAVQQADNLRPLAVAADERFKLAPDVPTLKEKGYNVVNYITREISVPKGTPQEVKEHLDKAFGAMAADPAFVEEMNKLGLPVTYMTMNEATKFRSDLEKDIGWIIESFKKGDK
ncbi:hypothetical protein Desku_3235 [Desulfofundulus kuznetsovii DSM 6115]|uniref:Uncharacterized protein n=1 Tax=Desulfofundulus kuznetsovii (strain DSM 6115 / VKM B-1805 / 17) TaxID=760568 RepID=A0AAU8PCP9_DESK7|nr:hypothetical protein Desku_3235 [Desulfofundulus kuznetsovii DSM 6115]